MTTSSSVLKLVMEMLSGKNMRVIGENYTYTPKTIGRTYT